MPKGTVIFIRHDDPVAKSLIKRFIEKPIAPGMIVSVTVEEMTAIQDPSRFYVVSFDFHSKLNVDA